MKIKCSVNLLLLNALCDDLLIRVPISVHNCRDSIQFPLTMPLIFSSTFTSESIRIGMNQPPNAVSPR